MKRAGTRLTADLLWAERSTAPEEELKLGALPLCRVRSVRVHMCVVCEARLVLLLALQAQPHLEHLLPVVLGANF